jgi:hypothetical protein
LAQYKRRHNLWLIPPPCLLVTPNSTWTGNLSIAWR